LSPPKIFNFFKITECQENDPTAIRGEEDVQRHFLHFLLKQILFIQEKNHGGGGEVFAVGDAVKQFCMRKYFTIFLFSIMLGGKELAQGLHQAILREII